MPAHLRPLAALALALAACTGSTGPAGKDGAGCTAVENADGSLTLSCGDGTKVLVREAGGTCQVAANADGSARIVCPDGSSATVAAGKDGASCTVSAGADGSLGVTCSDGSTVSLSAPEDGAPCQVATGSQGEVVFSCPDGSSATLPAPADGASCTIQTRTDGSQVLSCPDGSEAVLSAGRRRHVILVVGDGMPRAAEISGSRYLHGTDGGLSFHRFPYQTFVTTWDRATYDTRAALDGLPAYDPLTFDPRVGYDPSRGGDRPYPLQAQTSAIHDYFFPPDGDGGTLSLATDSASAATAMATGQKTDPGNIAWAYGDPAGGALESAAMQLRREQGIAIGVVSTVPFSHATPAAFVSHNPSRSNTTAIAEEILFTTRPEVVIGGGHPDFFAAGGTPSYAYLSEATLLAARASAEMVTVERGAGISGGRALAAAAGVAASSHLRLFGLFGGVGGSFEPGQAQSAPGAPEIRRGIEDPTLAEAATAALQVLATDEDGLFLLVEQGDIDWADHANDFNHLLASMNDLDRAVQAIVDYVDRPGDALDWSNTTLIVTADHCTGGLRFGSRTLGAGELPGTPASDWLTWDTTGHTNELVSLYARGAGAGLFWHWANLYPGKALVDDTAVYQVTLGALRGSP